MRLHRLRHAPTRDQLQEMLEAQGSYIKLAVDVRQGIVVGGGEYHADCEEVLLNIRPRQGNRSMEAQDPSLRARIEQVVRGVFEGTAP